MKVGNYIINNKNVNKINNIEMYSTYNEGKSAIAERFIRTLKNKILKHMTAISKNVYFDVLDDIKTFSLKDILDVDTSSFALKTNLASLKNEVDKLDIDKLVPIPVDLSKLSDVVKNDVVKKTVYDKLVAKVNNIDTSDLVLKTNYNTDKVQLENKIPNVLDFVKKQNSLNQKIKFLIKFLTQHKISNLATKADYNKKIADVENKLNNYDNYIDTSEFNKLAADVFNARLAQAKLITKTDFDTKLSSINRNTTQNKTKHLLVERELNKLKTFDSSYFIGKSYFDQDGTRNYLVFQPLNQQFKLITNTDYVSSWKSKGLSCESIKPPTTSDNILTPALNYHSSKTRVKFTGSCLKQSKI